MTQMMMKKCALLLALIYGTVGSVQACCTNGDARLYMLDKNTQTPTLSQEVFGQSGLPLSPLPSCMANHMSGLNTDEGSCNVLWCDCDHCYGGSNCQGTNDHPGDTNYDVRFNLLTVRYGPRGTETDHEYPCLDDQGQPALEPYLKCPPRTPSEQAASACQDKKVLEEAPEAIEARLSNKFCAEPAQRVGRTFVDQMLASLDANLDGSVSCAEWGIAKMTPTLEQLGGAYRGPQQIAPPECPMTPEGQNTLKQYNAYLSGLSVASAAVQQGH